MRSAHISATVGGQAQFYQPATARPADDWLAPLLDWIESNLREPLATSDLAARAGVSVRTLERRFAASMRCSPLRWVLAQRVRLAEQLLETTDQPVDWISDQCGFGTPASLRTHFGRITGVSPIAYRQAFGAPADRGQRRFPATRI